MPEKDVAGTAKVPEQTVKAVSDRPDECDVAAADLDSVVRGVGGGLTPKARRIRPLAGLIVILLVVLAAGYMQHGLKNRKMKKSVQADAPRAATGPATVSEKSWMDDQTRRGLDTGTAHVPASMGPRSSIVDGTADSPSTSADGLPGNRRSSIPPLQYTQTPVSAGVNGSLSFAEERRLELYKREQEAIESGTSVRGSMNGYGQQAEPDRQPPTTDPLQAIQAALLKARAEQTAGVQALAPPGGPGYPSEQNPSDFERQNGQFDKEGFTDKANSKEKSDYLNAKRTAALGAYEVKSGWLIPAVLEQELNSDLPGMIRALVRENVYDSVTGQYLLIPAGSTLIGMYNSHVGYGQNALQAAWKRIIFPDGSSLQLGGFESDDSQGAAGYRDQVDSHWARLFSGALLTSLFAVGIELSQGQNSSVLQNQNVGQQAGAAVGQQVGQLGVEVTRRNLNIQPTIKIRPGYRFFVRVEKDILFKGPYTPMRAGE